MRIRRGARSAAVATTVATGARLRIPTGALAAHAGAATRVERSQEPLTSAEAKALSKDANVTLDDLSPVPGGATFQRFAGTFPEGSDVASFPYEYKVGPQAP